MMSRWFVGKTSTCRWGYSRGGWVQQSVDKGKKVGNQGEQLFTYFVFTTVVGQYRLRLKVNRWESK